MVTPLAQSRLLIIGNDTILSYLLNRYAEQSGCQMFQRASAPDVIELRQMKPAAIIFSSLETLQAAQPLVDDLAVHEILVLVCVSVADEARARELGVDACLFHPLTYDNFCATLSAFNISRKN